VHVVCPVLTSPARHWTSDLDGARAEARERLERTLEQLRAAGVEAEGEIGDEDPLRAIEDVLRTFAADGIVVSGERDLVARVRERIALPIARIPIDAEAGVPLETSAKP
jgi:hypothetical protein